MIVLARQLPIEHHEIGQLSRELRVPTAVIIGLEEEFKGHTTGFIHKVLQHWLELPGTQGQSNMFTFLLSAIDKSMKSIDTKWITKVMVKVHKEGRALTDEDFKRQEDQQEPVK